MNIWPTHRSWPDNGGILHRGSFPQRGFALDCLLLQVGLRMSLGSVNPNSNNALPLAVEERSWRWGAIGSRLADLVLGRRCACCAADLPDNCGQSVRLCEGCHSSLLEPLPVLCLRCGSRIPHAEPNAAGPEHPNCRRCRNRRLPFERMICAGMYEGELRGAILRAKLPVGQPLAAALAGLLIARQSDYFATNRFDAVTPVPMHWRRRLQRGVNHAESIAAELSRRLGVPVNNALRRVLPTSPQGGLSAIARRKNIRGAFRRRPLTRIAGQRVLLVDDIVTTGATCIEAARTLREAGARDVVIAAIRAQIDQFPAAEIAYNTGSASRSAHGPRQTRSPQ